MKFDSVQCLCGTGQEEDVKEGEWIVMHVLRLNQHWATLRCCCLLSQAADY